MQLHQALHRPVLFDASVLMVGVDRQSVDHNSASKNIPYFSARDGAAMRAIAEVESLKEIELLGFEQLLLLGWLNNPNSQEYKKSYHSLYKSECSIAIKAGLIPETFNKYIIMVSQEESQ